MPRVLVVIARLNKGGTSQYIGQLASNLPKNKFQMLIATGFVQGSEIEDEIVSKLPIVRIKHLGRKIQPLADLRARAQLRKVIRDFNPDLIYSHTFKAGLLVRTLKTSIPIIHAFHGHLLDEPELKGLKIKIVIAIERKLATKAKYLVTVGKKVAEELQLAGVGRKSQYVSIPPGVKPIKIETNSQASKALGIENEHRIIIAWLARVVAVKCPERVVFLAQKFPTARFLMAGGGNLLEDIRKIAPENLSILGWKNPSEIWSVADIAISTSDNEGMPIALIEAQLAGVPVVALDVGSVSEVIESNVTGYVTANFDESYFSAIERLMANEELRFQLGRNGSKRAKIIFDPERLIEDHLNLFLKCI